MNKQISTKLYRYYDIDNYPISGIQSWLRWEYIRTFIISSIITAITMFAAFYGLRNFTSDPRKYDMLVNLLPLSTIILIMGYLLTTLDKLKLLSSSEYLKKQLLDLPWIIGETNSGFLLLELDEESLSPSCIQTVKEEMLELYTANEFMLHAALSILELKDMNQLLKFMNSQTGELFALAVFQIILEQHSKQNSSLFNTSDPLKHYLP